MGLINESNRQYYIGAQSFIATGVVNETFTATFDTNLVFATSNPADLNWPLNNFSLERSTDLGITYTPFYITYSVIGNTNNYRRIKCRRLFKNTINRSNCLG